MIKQIQNAALVLLCTLGLTTLVLANNQEYKGQLFYTMTSPTIQVTSSTHNTVTIDLEAKSGTFERVHPFAKMVFVKVFEGRFTLTDLDNLEKNGVKTGHNGSLPLHPKAELPLASDVATVLGCLDNFTVTLPEILQNSVGETMYKMRISCERP